MKTLCGLLFLGFSIISASADEIEKRRADETGKKYKEYTTLEGRVYRDVTITAINDAGISITHADGLARLRFEHLTPEQRKDFGITKEGSTAVYTEEMKAQAAHQAKVDAELKAQQKANEELLAKQEAALLEAELRAAERAQKQALATKIESTVEIPAFPVIRGSENAVLYGNQRQPSTRTTYYYDGPYIHHGGSGYYYPSYYSPYSPTYYSPHSHSNHCRPVHRGSIFHFTIK